MADDRNRQQRKSESGSKNPPHKGGDATRQAQKWGGGTKAGKGRVTGEQRRNPNASAKS